MKNPKIVVTDNRASWFGKHYGIKNVNMFYQDGYKYENSVKLLKIEKSNIIPIWKN